MAKSAVEMNSVEAAKQKEPQKPARAAKTGRNLKARAHFPPDMRSADRSGSRKRRTVRAKVHFPPDMQKSAWAAGATPVALRTKAAFLAIGLAVGSVFSAVVFTADGIVKIEEAWTKVVDLKNNEKGVAAAKSAEAAFNEKADPLYKQLTPALASVKPSIDMIVSAKADPAKLGHLVEARQNQAVTVLGAKPQFKDAATSLVYVFDAAAECLNKKECDAATWHYNFDEAFCQMQRTYSGFIDLQRGRLPGFAQTYTEVLKSIDCTKLLYG